jgi:hypothetical protein
VFFARESIEPLVIDIENPGGDAEEEERGSKSGL